MRRGMEKQAFRLVGVALGLLFVAACSDQFLTETDLEGPDFTHVPGQAPEVGHIVVCKTGASATFEIDGGPGPALADGECAVIVEVPIIIGQTTSETRTVKEIPAAGTQLDSVVITTVEFNNPPVRGAPITGTDEVTVTATDDAGVVVDFYNSLIPPPGGGEGCTPGYWRNHAGPDSFSNGGKKKPSSWPPTGFSPQNGYDGVFGVSSSFGGNLIDASVRGGGGENALGRHAVAALLNSAHPGVSYAFSTAEVIALVQQAYATGDFNDAKDALEVENEQGCPLN